MNKKKYMKPAIEDLTNFDLAHGSCWSGSGEKNLEGCISGGVAVDPCTAGTTVLPRTLCTDGGFAGASCFNGTDAG